MNEQMPPGAPIQHLGAVHRELRLEDDEELDGEFASSAEAEAAETSANYDTELTDGEINAIIVADTAARVARGGL